MVQKKEKTGYKDTLNLPRTTFPMKAGLPQREPELLKRWQQEDIYAGIIDKRKDSERVFILHDGPPYANGHIHMGHVLNKMLKDICVKYFTMKGFLSPFVPGWDCHGLPVEHQLFKELDITKDDIDRVAFRKKAHDYAMKYVRIQSGEFERLGIFGDWKNPYLTLARDYEADILSALADLYEKGYIYKDLKPVNWCRTCETALAEAEVEYEDKVSFSIYVKFEADPEDARGAKTFFVIWTTTPWTLMANVAIALHPRFMYSFVAAGDEVWIMASDLVPALAGKFGVKDYRVIEELTGQETAERIKKARHPFIDRKALIVLADYVTKEEGTGCVHTAPGHGQEDYLTGKKYGLPVIMPVEGTGKFSAEAGEFAGQDVFEANSAIIEKIRAEGVLIMSEEITHSYPHCWRCKEPIIFRATEQWFMNIDHLDLRKRMVRTIEEEVEWIPAVGQERIDSMVRMRPDWCLSRQRYWGVPIPAFQCVSCGETFTSAEIIRKIAGLTRKKGADVWFDTPAGEMIPKDAACRRCGGTDFRKEDDILDVWFDSGVSHKAVLDAREELTFPADLYLEGSDQHRGWFQAALITSMAAKGRAPYSRVLTHGFVVDGKGKKMSKSTGNVISPQDIMRKYGADILRLWVASSDYRVDIKVSPEILERLADGYRKIRNTFRFLLSNLYDFDVSKDALAVRDLSETDRWMLSRLHGLVEEMNGYYDSWEFYKVYRAVYNFCVYEVSAFYLDVSKDVLYVMAQGSAERRSAQTAVFRVLHTLVRIVAPILSFTAEEVWRAIESGEKEESVHMSDWPDTDGDMSNWKDGELDAKWRKILEIRDGVMKLLELKREEDLIGSPLEAAITLYSDDAGMFDFVRENIGLFPGLFKVSQATVAEGLERDMEDVPNLPLKIGVRRAPGEKCQRCWNFSETVGENKDFPDLCKRCYNTLLERSRNG
ncbi:MAG: isoleucine--tRNA ligase [Candidatus Makaraimicrobium thalassicum]|nr:MAG: isoleucine--tRNA ligase [Candidatus Omnitrophota bacterium]